MNSPSTGAKGYGSTAADGSYTVIGLTPAADYQVCFYSLGATGGSSDALGYAARCFNNQPTTGIPTPVTVTAGAITGAINAALTTGGTISGRVTDAGDTHHALANVSLYVSSPSTGAEYGGSTAADGTYTVTGLPPGTDYEVCFYSLGATGGSSDPTGYVDQCYNNQPLSGTATPVAVTVGATRPRSTPHWQANRDGFMLPENRDGSMPRETALEASRITE